MSFLRRVVSAGYFRQNFHRLPFLILRKLFLEPLLELGFFTLGKRRVLKSIFRVADISNIHDGADIVILGNGPSLADLDFSKLKYFVTLASNKIYLAFEGTDWRPTFYTVEDDLVLKQNIEKINDVESRKLMPASSMFLVGPIRDAEYFNFRQWHHYPKMPNFGVDATSGIYWGSTVVYTQIQLAVAMGAKRIILLGVDFSFSVPASAGGSTKEIISEGEINHFHEDYRKPGEKWNLPNLDKQILAFQAALEYCEKNGIQIINATPGSRLNVFPKADLSEIINAE